MHDSDPDWTLLPFHPQRFFGLRDEFDRKDLKRAYRDLVKRYKPEKSPEEFQLIRAAYEELTRRLERGAAPAIVRPVPPPAPAPFEPPEPESAPLESAPPEPASLESPRNLNSADEAEPLPTAEELRRLASEESAWTVFVKAQPIWVRLASESSFETNRDTFDECLRLVGLRADPRAPQASALGRLSILRRMMFRSNANWRLENLTHLEDHYLDLPEFLQDRLDLFALLARYASLRKRSFEDPEHRRFDEMVLAFAKLETEEYRRFIIEEGADVVARPRSFHRAAQFAYGKNVTEDSIAGTIRVLLELIRHLRIDELAEREGVTSAASNVDAVEMPSPEEIREIYAEEAEREGRHATHEARWAIFFTILTFFLGFLKYCAAS